MTFSLCYTSIRPEYIPEVVKLWLSKARNPGRVEVIIVIDQGDEACLTAANQAAAQCGQVVLIDVQPDFPCTCVKGWNRAASHAKGDVLIAVADDFVPPPFWDEKLASVGEAGWHTRNHVVKVWDGYNPDLCTLSILTKARYDRFGYIFYPGYLSLFCDTEFTRQAEAEKVIIEAMDLLFEHHHPDCQKRAKDGADGQHASSFRWNMGENLYNFRKDCQFPLDLGPVAEKARGRPKFRPEYDTLAVYVQAIKDDFCLFEVCYRMMEEGIRTFYFFIPSNYWSGEPTSADDTAEVKDVGQRLSNLGATVYCLERPVHFEGFANRLEVETHFRNASLDEIWAAGFTGALIMDGDELWQPGFLKIIAPYIDGVDALQCQMVPVIGLPGYPVEGSMDNAVVYIRRGNHFKMCRTPEKETYHLAIRGVVHFTATRKTHDEIIAKMRAGGHYDDPDYDFEGWIQRKLPNIQPGMTNAHMYRPYQIWPSVRAWHPEEINAIPPSIRPFIGLPCTPPPVKKPSLVEMAQLLNRPPCPEASYYRVGVFVGSRR